MGTSQLQFRLHVDYQVTHATALRSLDRLQDRSTFDVIFADSALDAADQLDMPAPVKTVITPPVCPQSAMAQLLIFDITGLSQDCVTCALNSLENGNPNMAKAALCFQSTTTTGKRIK